MSEREYRALMSGATLENMTIHSYRGMKSDAIGFCFFAEDPEEAVHWLSGVCCTDVLVTLDMPEATVNKAAAYYRDSRYDAGDLRHAAVKRTDYCLTRYSLDHVRILDVTRKYRLDGVARIFAMAVCPSYINNMERLTHKS